MPMLLAVLLAASGMIVPAPPWPGAAHAGILPVADDDKRKPPEFIGTCWMEADGTILMYLVSHGAGGIIGHGLLTYRPQDRDYPKILEHVGPLEPGETKPVRAWPN